MMLRLMADGDADPDRYRTTLKRLGPVAWLGALTATLPKLGSIVLFTNIEAVSAWLRQSGMTGAATYVVGFWVLAGCALLPTYATAAVGGWAFGAGMGLICAMLGFVGASAIGYAIARRASGDRVTRLVSEKPRWNAIAKALFASSPGKTLLIVSLLRLPPNSPFAITNLVLASLNVKPGVYLLGTFLGMLPRTAAIVYAASHVQQLTLEESADWRWIAAGIAVTIGVLTILWYLSKSALRRMTVETE